MCCAVRQVSGNANFGRDEHLQPDFCLERATLHELCRGGKEKKGK